MTNKERKRIDAEESFQDRLYEGYFPRDRATKSFIQDEFGTVLVLKKPRMYVVNAQNEKPAWKKASGQDLRDYAELVKGRIKTSRALRASMMPVADEMAAHNSRFRTLMAVMKHERKLAKTKTRASKSGGR